MRALLVSLCVFAVVLAPAAEPSAPPSLPAPAAAPAKSAPVDRIAARLSGSFTNLDQYHADGNFRNVALHVIRLWPGRSDGMWFYLEEALAGNESFPYRQQVFQLVADGASGAEIHVFKLPEAIAPKCSWKEPARFAELSPDSLAACPACSIRLKEKPDGSFAGATEGKGCPGEIQNAAYSTRDLTIGEAELTFWDRGYADNGRQVWGPPNQGYVFKRAD